MATKTGQKYIICDSAISNQGKSILITAVAQRISNDRTKFKIIEEYGRLKKDCWIVVEEITTRKRILFQSAGDNADVYKKTIQYLAFNEVDIVVIASHTYGITMKMVKTIASSRNFEELFFTHVHPKNCYSWKKSFTPLVTSFNEDMLYQLIINL